MTAAAVLSQSEVRVREIVREELRGLGAELLERVFHVPQDPNHFNMRIGESIEDAAEYRQVVADSILGVVEEQVDERPAALHTGRNLDGAQGGSCFGIGNSHGESPSLHGRLTRYVTGAIVAASRWLQRKAWARQATATAPRPSGTMQGGAE